jgi:hypothetical protein
MNHIHFDIPVDDAVVDFALYAVPIVAFFWILGALAESLLKDTK